MEVIYTGLRQTPEQIVGAALQEDADVIGLSILSGAHMHICPRVMELLRENGLTDVLVVVGGIIPDVDVPKLNAIGIEGIFLPGTPMQEIVDFINRHARARVRVRVYRGTVTHKLLLADDSVTIQRVVELTFSGEDIEVIAVSDGEQAIARIPVERPDIVLADIGMPKRSGYEVAAFVKGRPDLCAHSGAAAGRRVRARGRCARAAGEVRWRARQAVRAAAGRVARAGAGRRRQAATTIDERHRDAGAACARQPCGRAATLAAIHAETPAHRQRARAAEARESRSEARRLLPGSRRGVRRARHTRSKAGPPMPPDVDDFRASDVPTLEELLGLGAAARLRRATRDVPCTAAGIGADR